MISGLAGYQNTRFLILPSFLDAIGIKNNSLICSAVPGPRQNAWPQSDWIACLLLWTVALFTVEFGCMPAIVMQAVTSKTPFFDHPSKVPVGDCFPKPFQRVFKFYPKPMQKPGPILSLKVHKTKTTTTLLTK